MLSRAKKLEEIEKYVIKEVRIIRKELRRIGTRKLYHMLKSKLVLQDLTRDRFFDILRRNRLFVERRAKLPKTTYSKHNYIPHENLLKDFTPQKPREALVADITYIRTKEGFVYLFLITDHFSRYIVGDHLSKSLSHEGAIQAVTNMLVKHGTFENAIHHTDRGSQYCCHNFIEFLEKNHIRPSHTDNDHAAQNAIAERVNGILKDEFFLDWEFMSFKEARKHVTKAIRLYNNKRVHCSLALETPVSKFLTILPDKLQMVKPLINFPTDSTTTVNII